MPASSPSSIRPYSSDSQSSTAVPDDDTSKAEDRKTSSSTFGSAFSFQSLSGLFEQPRQARYSRSRDNGAQAPPSKPAADLRRKGQTVVTVDMAKGNSTTAKPIDRSESIAEPGVRGSESQDLARDTNQLPKHQPPRARIRLHYNRTKESLQERNLRLRKNKSKMLDRAREGLIAPTKQLNPFSTDQRRLVTRSERGRSDRGSGPMRPSQEQHLGKKTERPWGFGATDAEPIDSLTEPKPNKLVLEGQRSASEDSAMPASPSNTEDMKINAVPGLSVPSKLTHLTASGEAHMVDIGAKTDTKRVAIAVANVVFSHDEPINLIMENTNKKGDVLGVARIAGIMAAKRTSDIVPLCHPVAISKITIDLEPKHRSKDALETNQYGSVDIIAEVHCTGPTGVEMEALTAVSGAALTVYDMCKAVDKNMAISNSRVVYKSGGRSGLYIRRKWALWKGKKWFDERELDLPRDLNADFRLQKRHRGFEQD